MKRHVLRLIFASCLLVSTSWAATDPFLGQWKLNGSKTKFTDEMKVESLGANKYGFDFGGGVETIVVDGTDQPGGFGTILSVSAESPHAWKVVRKAHGRTLLIANWTLSDDGQSLTDDFTEFGADGSPMNTKYVYRRKAAGSGFAGDWVSSSATLLTPYIIKIQTWKDDGLSFVDGHAGQTKNVKFDGQDYRREGPNASPGATTSIRRVNERTLEMTDKVNGKITATRQITLSDDLNTLTFTVHVGGGEPRILIFDRQQ